MMTQLKYSLRHGLSLRLTMLLISLAVNLGFFLAWQMGARHIAVQIVGVVLSSLSLTGILVCSIIADVVSAREVFRPPYGYPLMLAPVKGWKILAGKVLATLVGDCVGMVAGIVGVVGHALLLGGHSDYYLLGEEDIVMPLSAEMGAGWSSFLIWGIVFFVLYYLLFILLIYFAEALRAGVFHKMRGGGVLGAAGAIVACYIMSFSNLILMPFGAVERYGLFVNIALDMSLYPGTILLTVLLLAQSAVLFALTANVIERKINL